MFEMKFKTGNACFCNPYTGEQDEYYRSIMVAKILSQTSEKIKFGITEGKIIDINGNHIGEWRLER